MGLVWSSLVVLPMNEYEKYGDQEEEEERVLKVRFQKLREERLL